MLTLTNYQGAPASKLNKKHTNSIMWEWTVSADQVYKLQNNAATIPTGNEEGCSTLMETRWWKFSHMIGPEIIYVNVETEDNN